MIYPFLRAGALTAAMLLAVAMVQSGCSSSGSRAKQKETQNGEVKIGEVKIDNFSFSPASLTVAAGTTVTWINHDDIPHTVVSTDDPRAFRSKALDTDDKFSFTFAKPGTYAYFCSLHPKMTGQVIVR